MQMNFVINIVINNRIDQSKMNGTWLTAQIVNVAADVAAYTPGWISGDINSQVGDPQFINPTGNAAEFSTSSFYASEARYVQSKSATISGAELEFRVLLSTLFARKNEKSMLNNFTLSGHHY